MTLPEPEEFARRRKKLFTQKEFAKIMGISQSLISKFETNESSLMYDKVKKIDQELSIRENKGKFAKDVMIKEVFSLSSSDNLKKAIDIMKEKGFSQLPIIEKGKVVGSITESKALELIQKDGLNAYPKKLSEVMEETLPFVSSYETLDSLRARLKNAPAVLVMDKGELKGIISRADVL
ncbi:CBS domain-containing protein [Candidatus Woesearchaeota archaeon]|nr:CBS domain-containing protein [Candidatus Woesearchaeota archaeon]